jgi:L-ascorbate metabolism protein UlaG (beta-lactamase superfamily)
LDWWQAHDIGGTVLTCLPSQHWSRRIGQSRNATLWASYMIETPEKVIYFAGDSGYFIGYREFGRKFEDIDYALLPITAYHPRWFMHYAHLNVDEALAAFKELKAKYFLPTQWGTFHLGDNPPGFPMFELDQKIRQMDLDSQKYLRPQLGEIILMTDGEGENS